MAVGLTWGEIDGYLDQALDLAPAERELWLAELTTSEPRMARMLRQLLAECEAINASQFLENSPLSHAGLPGIPRAKLEGAQIGAYTIERLLGRGGMSEVWLARRSDGRFALRQWPKTPAARPRPWMASSARQLGQTRPVYQALAQAVTHLANTVDETHPSLVEARALSTQRLNP